jgi:hypothetical protein
LLGTGPGHVPLMDALLDSGIVVGYGGVGAIGVTVMEAVAVVEPAGMVPRLHCTVPLTAPVQLLEELELDAVADTKVARVEVKNSVTVTLATVSPLFVMW